MLDTLPILAKDDDAIKLVIGLVVGAIWLISAIVGAAKNKKPQGEQKPWEQVLRDLGVSTPPPQQPPQQQRRPQPPPMPPKQQKRKKQKQRPQPPPTPVAGAADTGESSTHRVVEEISAPLATTTASRSGPPAVSLGKTSMLLTPQTVREAIILNEILSKPVSMREG